MEWLRSGARGFVGRAGIVALHLLAILVGALAGLYLAYQSDLPQVSSLEDFRPNIITQVYARDGSLIGEFSIERRVVVDFPEIPPVLRNAIVSVEDADFWKHLGINPWSIPRAAIANLRSGRWSQGFSTLTMQLSRLLFLTPEKTIERKVKQIILAFQIEKNFTKEEILTLYCNQVYFGHGNYGVEAASQFFFSKPIGELSLAEAALLAGIPQNPARLSPLEHPERAVQRRNHVLDRMVEERYVTKAEASEAQAEALRLRQRKASPSIAPHFIEEVRKSLERSYGSQRIYQGGLRVYTTLDPKMQLAANRALREGLLRLDRQSRGFVPPTETILEDGQFPADIHLPEWNVPIVPGDVVRGVVLASEGGAAAVRIGDYTARVGPEEIAWTESRNVGRILPAGTVAPFRILELDDGDERLARVRLEQEPEVEGALIALDVRTGDVRAMVGGYDFERSKFNRAIQAMRQVGSAFKPILYTAAIERAGYTPATLLDDAPLTFHSRWSDEVWRPRNYDGSFLGPITLRRALEKSRNLPAVRTLNSIGIETGIEYARKLGLMGPLPPYLPIALGAGEATLVEMTAAFATFPNQGLRMEPRLITRVSDRDGNIVEETRPHATEAIRADTAYLMTSLLQGVVQRGTAVRARSLKRPIGGKTGTTNDWTDGWFIGFEPSLAAGVWVGYDQKKNSLGRGRDGGRTALPIWIDFWGEAMGEAEIEEYPVPANIVFVPVDGSGRRVAPASGRREAFVAGTEPNPGWAAPVGSGQEPSGP
jgi:penicillin-binding protein 1A